MTDNNIKKCVSDKIKELINKASSSYNINNIFIPEIKFTKRGKCAGCVSYVNGEVFFNFNMVLLRENFNDFLSQTVPHEVSHFIVYLLFGHQYTKGGKRIIHGKDWKNVMSFFGCSSERCHSYNTSKSSVRKLKTFKYKCGCSTHILTSIRHNRIKKGTSSYCCSVCGERLEKA